MVVVGTSGIPNDPATTSVKKQLNSLGVGDERMGYDKSSGSIKVDGQNIVNNPNKGISTFSATTNQNPYSTMSNYQNPYDNQMNDALTQYLYALRNPRQYTTQDAMNTAQYNAAQANIARQSHQATRQAQEALGGAGLGRSSVLADRAQNIQNEESNYLNTQVIPQIIQQLQSQDQQQVQNLQNILSAISQQQNLYDTRYNDAFSRSITEAGLTGRYIPQQAQDVISQLLSLKQEAERPDLGAETYAAYKAEGDKLRNQLIAMGIDPSFISSDVTSGQAAQNIPSAFATMDARNQQFNQNMAQQQMEYQAARDAIADQRYQQEFDRDAERWGLEYALQKQIQLGNLDVSRMNAATSRMNAQTSRMDADRRQTEYSSSQDAQGIQSQIVGELSQFSSPAEAKEWLNANAGYITQQLGANGLQQMYQMAETLYGRDVDTTAQDQARQQQLRDQAIRMAQNDMRWGQTDTDRNALIQEYMNLIMGG